MTDRAGSGAPRRRGMSPVHAWLTGSLLFICVLAGYLLSFNVDQPTHNGDWYIRYQVTCSIVERNAFYVHRYSPDARVGPGVDGRIYSQYTLGQSTALIPLYLLGRALAGVAHTNCDAVATPAIVFLTGKTLDLILGTMLCVLFFATARLLRYTPRQSLTLTLLLAFGTALWPDVLTNLEHTMESLFLLAAAYAALRYTVQRRQSRLWVAVMGLAAGLIFLTRIAGVIAPPIFALYLLVLHRRRRLDAWRRSYLRDLALFAACVAPSVLINGVFDALRFGSPLRFGPYPDQSLGYPPWLGLPNLLLSPGKGLVWYTPALLLLVLAIRPFWRRYPLPAILFSLICGVYVLFYANVTYWHGDPAWGPRYLYPMLPYLILPLGEVLRRWQAYRLAVRGLATGLLAASFLVQLAAVTVSYWRYWHWFFAYHYDEVRRYTWGFSFNNWWQPEQSPIALALSSVATIARNYVDHAPVLDHAATQRLGNPVDLCFFRVFGHASICLADADKLRYVAAWNTVPMWWAHSYPWWGHDTVLYLAVALAAVFVLSGALLALVSHAPRVAGISETSPISAAARAAVGLAPLGTAILMAMLVFGGIVGVGAVGAPGLAPPLIRTVAMSTTVRNGTWTYRVLGVGTAEVLPRDAGPRVAHHHYVIVRLSLRNLAARSNGLPAEIYALVDITGQPYPWYPWQTVLRGAHVELYGSPPFATMIPARTGVTRVLVAVVPDSHRRLELLGPGITLVRLDYAGFRYNKDEVTRVERDVSRYSAHR